MIFSSVLIRRKKACPRKKAGIRLSRKRGRVFLAGQSMMEYAVLIAAVSAALVGMQIYIKRGMQGRLKDLADQVSPIQYERGNTTSNYTTTHAAKIVETADRGTFTRYMGAYPAGEKPDIGPGETLEDKVGTGETTTRTGWERTIGSN